MTGLFITLEGGEGSGKSTQAKLLADALGKAGHKLRLTREPGGTPGAEAIRELLVNGPAGRWGAMAETLLFFAARAEHLEKLIQPAMGAGEIVICDRFVDSTIVYQGIAKGLGDAFVRDLHQQVFGGFLPDLTFLLDIDPAEGLKRARARKGGETRFEQMDIAFHRQLRKGFLNLAADDRRFAIVDASWSTSGIHATIIEQMNARLGLSLTPVENA